jgi:EF hand
MGPTFLHSLGDLNVKIKTLPLALSALLLSGASFLAVAADESMKPAADQGTSMPQPDKAKADPAAQPDQAAKPGKDATAQMKTLDTDNDGTLTKAEAGKMKGLTEGFDAADKNKDGTLDTAELTAAMSHMKK